MSAIEEIVIKLRGDTSAFTSSMKQAQQEAKQFESTIRGIKSQSVNVKANVDKSHITSLKNDMATLRDKTVNVKASETGGGVIGRLKADLASLRDKVVNVTVRQQGGGAAAAKGGGGMGGIGTGGMLLAGAAGGGAMMGVGMAASGMESLVGGAVDYLSNIEQSGMAFEVLLKDQKKATELMGTLKTMAAATPFEFPDLANASKLMLSFGYNAKDIPKTLTTIGNTASAFGAGAEGMNTIVTSMGRMQQSGKVNLEYLNLMNDMGVPAIKYLAEGFYGTATSADDLRTKIAKTYDEISTGSLDANKAIGFLTTGMDKDFGGMMDKQSRTFSGMMSTLKDTTNEFLGSALKPAFTWLSSTGMPGMIGGLGTISQLMSGQKTWGQAFGDIGESFKKINWGDVGNQLKQGLRGLGKGIFDFGAAIVDSLKSTDWGQVGTAFLNGLKDIKSGLKELGGEALNALKSVDWGQLRQDFQDAILNADWGNIARGILEAFDLSSIADAIGGAFSGIGSAFGGIGGAIMGALSGVGAAIGSIFGSIGSTIMGSLGGIGDAIRNQLSGAFGFTVNLLNSAADFITNQLAGAFGFAVNLINSAASFITNQLAGAFGFAVNLINSAADFIRNQLAGAFGFAVNLLTNVANLIRSALSGAFGIVIDITNNIRQAITDKIGGAFDAVVNLLPKPGAEGLIAGAAGMVALAGGASTDTRSPYITSGPQLALIGEAGPEAVIPKKYWSGVDPWVLNALPKLQGGAVMGSSSSPHGAGAAKGDTHYHYHLNLSGLTSEPLDEKKITKMLMKTELMRGVH